jgi:hypothetical protein
MRLKENSVEALVPGEYHLCVALDHEATCELIEGELLLAKLKERFAGLGGSTIGGSRAEFGNLIVAETEKWAKVIKFAGIKPE